MRTVIKLVKILVIVVGLLAGVHIVCLFCDHPLVRLVEVTGRSMAPTLMPGDKVLFVRRSWRVGSVVLAEADEAGPVMVIKRVVRSQGNKVFITGDNKEKSESYQVNPDKILGVMLWHIDLTPPHSPPQ